MFLGVDNRLRRYGTGRSGCRPVGHGSLPQFSTQRPVPKSQAHALGLSLARSALSTVTSSTDCHVQLYQLSLQFEGKALCTVVKEY